MGSDYLGDVYTLADIASAADSTEAEVRVAAASSRKLWSYDDAVRIGRLLVANRYAASTRLEAQLFSPAADGAGLRAAGIPAVVSGSLHLGLLGVILIAFGLAPRAATTATDEERTNVPSRLVFLATPGPGGGGGGGGGGIRQKAPPPQAESKGHEAIASPLPERELPKAAMPLPKPEIGRAHV